MSNKSFRKIIGLPGSETRARNVLVVGLGRFGSSLAQTLVEMQFEVRAIDTDDDLVQKASSNLPDVLEGDATDAVLLKQVSAADFDVAVVAIGTDLEASILTTAALKAAGVEVVWAKALSKEHADILRLVGATEVVLPERDMGERVAHMISGQMLNYFETDDGFRTAEVRAPASLVGKTLGEAAIRQTASVNVVAVKQGDGPFTFATASTRVAAEDLLVIAGDKADVERFARKK